MIDLLIIGAGPIGLACGIAAKAKGKSYVIIDKGCLVNSLYHYPVNMTFFSTADRLEIGGIPFISKNPKPTRSEALEYYRRVTMTHQLNVRLYECVQSVAGQKGNFTITTDKQTYNAAHIVIATGFYDLPYLLNVPGEDLPKVRHYYNDPHPYFGMHLAIVGAANSAVDVALETYRKGAASVTMVIREKEIAPSVKYWVRPDIINRIAEGSITAYFESHVVEIRENEVAIQTPTGLVTLANDFVLAMTGYQPDFKFLQSCGIQQQEDEDLTPVYNAETMETNVPGIYLAGVICGGLRTNKWFIENSRIHAEMILSAIK